MDPLTIALIGSGLISGIGSLWGAKNQGDVNNQNLASQNAWRQQLMGMIQPQMQMGANPFAQQMLSFLGGGAPGQTRPWNSGSPQTHPGGLPHTWYEGGGGGGGGGNPADFAMLNQGGGGLPQTWYGGGEDFEPNPFKPIDPSELTPEEIDQLNGTGTGTGTGTRTGPGTTGTPIPGYVFPNMSMYRYQPWETPQLDPSQINVAGFGTVNPMNVSASGLGAAPTIGAPSSLSGLPNVNAQSIDPSAIGTSGFNAGQDALMQMLRRDLSVQPDAGLSADLKRFTGGQTGFDTSGMLGALDQSNQRLMDDQVSQLRGSAGSLGERLGSNMFDAEARLRGDLGGQFSLQRQSLLQSSHESAQSRAMEALGLSTGREQFFAGMPLQELGLRGNIAQGLGGLGASQSELIARIMQGNAGNALTASQANAGNALQGAMQTQQLGTQVGMQNAANWMQQGQFGAGQTMQASLANQDAALRAALQGQSLQAQGMTNNANIMNQAQQFNIGNWMQQDQFGAQQGNIYNQLMMSGMGQAAGLDQQSRGLNAQLLGILGGVGIPQQQPSTMPGALGGIGDMGMLLALLMGNNK